MFKKSAIAVAVAAACGASIPAHAVPVGKSGTNQVYGFVNVSMDYMKVKNGGTGDIFLPNQGANDSHFQLGDQANSRFGFKGEEDLGNGLKAGYKIEMGLGTSAYNRGSVSEDISHIDKRLAYVTLSGNWGEIKAGNTWGKLYEYLGYNTVRSYGFGGSTWYEMTRHLNYDAYGLRVSDALNYTYGSGGYGSDPFTFSVQGIFAPPNNNIGGSGGSFLTPSGSVDNTSLDNTKNLNAEVVAGAVTFGKVTINAAYYGENDPSGIPAPKLYGGGARFQVTNDLMLSGTVMELDRDVSGIKKPVSIEVHGEYNFGNGILGMLSYGHVSNTGPGFYQDNGSLNSYFASVHKELGHGADLYIEAEHDNFDVPGPNPQSTVVSVGMIKYF